MSKIVFVAHGLGNGGAERVASILASNFAERGYEVTYLAVYNNNITYSLDDRVDYQYLDINNANKFSRFIRRSHRICQYIDEIKPEVIISFIVQEMVYTSLKNKYKIIYSERTNPESKNLLLRTVTNMVYKKSKMVVFQTPGARDYFEKKIREKSTIILNPIEKTLPTWNGDKHEKVIITACRIAREKNLEMLIRAFRTFSEKHRDYILKIYGKSENLVILDELKSLVSSLNLDNRVMFPGYVKNIKDLLSDSAIFALTSNFEGLSNSMLEALCIGIPTICTDCPAGGAAMVIKNGENGFLVSMNDSDALSQRMMEIVDSRELQIKLSSNALKLREQLDVSIIMDQWEEAIN